MYCFKTRKYKQKHKSFHIKIPNDIPVSESKKYKEIRHLKESLKKLYLNKKEYVTF